jgi:hypothetical protein
MTLRIAPILAAALGCLALAACQKDAAPAPTASAAPKTDGGAAPKTEYHPSMGDLMTMAVQPRHTKLGLAGKAKNWTYAAYEADELKNAFGRVARTIPTYRKNAVAQMADANMKAPIEALSAAAKAGDAKAFTEAYAKVTDGCNACHKALEHG